MNFPAGTSVPSFLQSLHHCMSYKDAHENLISCKVKRDVFHDKMFRVPTLLLIKKFQDFPGHLTMLFQYSVIAQQHSNTKTNSNYLLHIYRLTVQSIVEWSSPKYF